MKRRLDGLILIGLGISLLLALFLSPFASSSPDGLEKVAETKGFAEKGEGWKLWKYAPFPDYAIPWIKNEKVKTSLSGLIGTLAIFFIAFGIGKFIRKAPIKKILILISFYCSVFLTLALTSTFIHAARPLSTDDAWTLEQGGVQLEFGFDAIRQDSHDREFSPSLTLSYGLSENVDISLGTGYLFLHPNEGKKEKGLTDTRLKLKYRWMNEKDWRPALALTGSLKIPTASESKELGSGQPDFSINAIVTKNLNQRWVLHLNLGVTFIGAEHGDNELNYSLGCQFVVTNKWALVGEVFGINNLNGRKGDDPFSTLLGTTYLIKDNIVLDAGVEIGMSKASPDFRFSTGLTLLFKP